VSSKHATVEAALLSKKIPILSWTIHLRFPDLRSNPDDGDLRTYFSGTQTAGRSPTSTFEIRVTTSRYGVKGRGWPKPKMPITFPVLESLSHPADGAISNRPQSQQ